MIVIGRVPKLLPLNKVTENRIVTEKTNAALITLPIKPINLKSFFVYEYSHHSNKDKIINIKHHPNALTASKVPRR